MKFSNLIKYFGFKSNKFNLLIELDTFDKGGLQKVVLDSVLRINPDNFNINIISIGARGYLAEVAKKQGLKVIGLPDQSKDTYFNNLLRNNRWDLSISHFSPFGYPFYYNFKIPNITFIHNVYAFLSKSKINQFLADDRFVDLYVAVSVNAKKYAVNKLGLPADKIITIPNGLIVEEHNTRLKNTTPINRSEFGISNSDYVFLNTASYNLHKGHYLMADAMKHILSKRKDIKIICIGNIIYPPHVTEFKNYLVNNQLDKNIIMPGYFPNIESFYSICDAFLLPSFIEGWSIAMNEAMFYEKPMILTDTGASSEVIINNDIGILIENEYGDIINLDSEVLDNLAYNQREFRTASILAEAMINFADHKEYWKEAGKGGRNKIINNYNFDIIVNQYEIVFENLIRKR